VSRFADPSRTAELDLGECTCAGTPHERDLYVYRTELGDAEEGRAGAYGWAATGHRFFDSSAALTYLVAEVAGVSWSFVNEDGTPVPMRAETASLLDERTLGLMGRAIDAAQTEYRKTLPNVPAGPSRSTSQATGSRTRKTRTRR